MQLVTFRQLSLPGLRFLIVVLLVLGIVFRLVNIDRKVYWHDEAYTSLRIAGYTSKEVKQNVFNGQIINPAELQKYQRPNPEKNWIDTIESLAFDDAQHPPLYYLLVRFWVEAFGTSVAVTRSFSAFVSLLVFPCVYWLCLELFALPLVGWVAMALIAVSPFHVLYAQEARAYSLWTVLILLSSCLLLSAWRRTKQGQTKLWLWGSYALTLALGLYTFPFTGLVAIGHGVYLFIIERCRLTQSVIAYLGAFLLAIGAFVPWIVVILASESEPGIAWTAMPIPLITWLKLWGLHIERAFILTFEDFGFDHLLIYLTLPIFLFLVSYSIYFLCKIAPRHVWLFVLTLMVSLALFLALPDLILGGQRSTSSRYLVPFYLGLQLSVAYLLATQITATNLLKRKFWQVVMVLVLTAGVVSCAIASQAETAWNKVVSYNNYQIAQIINQSPHPLLISDSFGINFGNSLALSHQLEPKVRLQLFERDSLANPTHNQGFSDIFLLNSSEQFREKIEAVYNRKLKLVFNDFHLSLWQLSPERSG